MALFMNQQNDRTELQKRIAAELADKAKKKAEEPTSDRPDGVNDSAYLEKTKTTTSLAWLWAIIAIAVIAVLIWLVVASS